MKKLFVALASCALFLTGCDGPDNMVMWSPDGKRLAVKVGGDVSFGDTTGKFSGEQIHDVERFRWGADSNHAVIVTEEIVTDWKDIKGIWPDDPKQLALARKCWLSKNPARFIKQNPSFNACSWLYLKNLYGQRLYAQKVRALGKDWRPEDISVTVETLRQLDLSSPSPVVGPGLYSTVHSVTDVSLAPSGKYAALSIDGDRITVVPLAGGQAKSIAARQLSAPAWSPDGKTLLYFSSTLPASSKAETEVLGKNMSLGSLNSIDVEGPNGHLMPTLGPAKVLAEALMNGASRARALPDGSVLFNAVPRKYPDLTHSDKPGLFKLSADRKSIEQLIVNGALPDNMVYFEPNSNCSKIAVPGRNGAVAVLDVQSGNVTVLEKNGPRSLTMVPVWRTDDELCYATTNQPPVGDHAVDIVLHSLAQPANKVNISGDWPAKTYTFLEVQKAPVKQAKPITTKTKTLRNHQTRHPARH